MTQWKSGMYTFRRDKAYGGEDIVNVWVNEGDEDMFLTSITQAEVNKKKLDFYSDTDIEYFKKTYR